MAISCLYFKQYNMPEGFEIRKYDTIIDIGSHIGSFALFAASQTSTGNIFAFEPDTDNYTQLIKNIKENYYKNISAFQYAVSNSNGTVTLYRSNMNNAENSIYKKGSESITVKSITLSDIIKQHKITAIDFLKLDCEGAEYNIIFESPKEIFNNIEKIVMECHTPKYFDIANPRYNQKAMIEYLQTLGYKTKCIRENAIHDLIFAKRI
ncbi:FkbM family methyltransferase [Patescibacteria group bacterium]